MSTQLSNVITATTHPVGTGCTITQFRHDLFPAAMMSPFVMVDHFHMWEPTFDVHPHAGFSAVTLVFEDAKGTMVSQDSLGNNAIFGAGDLHWTMAGRGIMHTQIPVGTQSHIHALQIFVNLPAAQKNLPADSFHISSDKMPIIKNEGSRVRVVAGDFQGHRSLTRAPRPILMLDVQFQKKNVDIEVPMPGKWNAWIHVIKGHITIDNSREIGVDQAVCISADDQGGTIKLKGSEGAHCVILSAERIDEPVIARGPFVFESETSLEKAVNDFHAGKFGSVVSKPC
ncbi:pirin family protein [Buttiauxella sp. A2-C2_NF]|uniref:pirin family protein n=1 Tax=Buttiauxella ferragutiae TaxID=82989 RepID=UPI001E351A0D|nr:pirin-like C-terminal cupin domain-containing protein [Buttiauxella ferragutiae]MCE0826754.1 pirin family protein [Buttiauxella ferragutiae]